MNLDQLGGIWKEIIPQPPGIILKMAMQAVLKAYLEESIDNYKEVGQLVGWVPSVR